jgi:hypothetical protein
MELTTTTIRSATWFGTGKLRKYLPCLFGALLSAFPLPSLAAMVYGSVTNCDGTIDVWKDNTRWAVVPVQNRSYQVVLPPGTYRAICTGTSQSLTIRSDPSPVRQNLNFSN